MDYLEFRRSLKGEHAPRAMAPLLRALWHDARGDWDRAHRVAASERTVTAARVHAYLHRKEGDSDNAKYWYARAGTERPRVSLHKEWEALVRSLLEKRARP